MSKSRVRRVVVAAAAALVACGCAGSPPSEPPFPALNRTAASADAWKPFVEATEQSGCPSIDCSVRLALVEEGAMTRLVPWNLTPRTQDAPKDLRLPDGANCTKLPVPGLDRRDQPCVFRTAAGPSAPMMVLIGNSRATLWSRALAAVASQGGYRFGAVAREGCSMSRIANTRLRDSGGEVDCGGWKTAAINWVNQQKPAVVLVAGGPDMVAGLNAADITAGYGATLAKLSAPKRKVFVFGEVPRLDADPPKCLAVNNDAQLCATHPFAAAAGEEQQAVLDAAQQAGATYINVTPWLCTDTVCPATVGFHLPYRDRTHLTTTFTEQLIPVLKRTLKLPRA